MAFGDEPRAAVTRLNRAGQRVAAVELADSLLTQLTDPGDLLGVYLSKLAALLNLEQTEEGSAVMDEAWALIERHPDLPAADVAEYHAVVAYLAHAEGDFERCVTNLVRGAKALDATETADRAVRPWMAMAVTYSNLGFHDHAVAAQLRAKEFAVNADQLRMVRHPEIPVRQAAFLDQTGATAAAKAVLAEVVGSLAPDDLVTMELRWLGYAIARYSALGGRCDTDIAPSLLDTVREPASLRRELRDLGSAALAIAEGRTDDALVLLHGVTTDTARLGSAEVPRLRALAYAASGDHAAAYEAEREATLLVASAANPLYDLFVNGITTRLDVDELRRNADRYADEAQTDPLTGLPNRRRLERFVHEIIDRGGSAVIGVGDLDRFKAVNTAHGHLVGDRVLAESAEVLSRGLRSGDFLARYGGDEFVVVFPDTGLADAQKIVDRLTAAFAAHDWSHLAAGTPVTLTMCLAELDFELGMAEAFHKADLLMLRAKEAL